MDTTKPAAITNATDATFGFTTDTGAVFACSLDGAPADAGRAVADVSDDDLAPLVQDLGGHDLTALLEAFAEK